jgi:hypothetical protein
MAMGTASNHPVVAFFFSGPDRLNVWNTNNASWLSVLAVSGGGRGQKINGARLPYGHKDSRALTSVSYRTKENEDLGVRGGPIPPGLYKIHKSTDNSSLGRSSFLEPDPSNIMYKRDQLYIHGSGKKGSDGCIIPGDTSVFPILDLIDKLYEAYRGNIYLKAISGEVTLPASIDRSDRNATA